MRHALLVSADIEIRGFAFEDESAVISIWHACGLIRRWNDPAKDIRRKVAVGDEFFLVATAGGSIVGTVMAGYDGHRGWINYLAVDPDRRRSGIGRELMAEAERRLSAVGCPKINLQVRATNDRAVGFYEHIGYSTDDVVSLGKRIEVDEQTQ
jgi:ribosomal protein S18 acetylase RimI-like enzyme